MGLVQESNSESQEILEASSAKLLRQSGFYDF